MFYVCDEKDGKFGVKDSRDGVIEYYTADELDKIKADSGCRVFGSRKDGGYFVIKMDEYQELDWGTHTIFSFVNKNSNDLIYIGVEEKSTSKILYFKTIKSELTHDYNDYESCSQNLNGDLQWIFEGGRVNKCAGFCLWLDYLDEGDPCKEYCDFYLEIFPDGSINLVDYNIWTWDETGHEYSYDEETDRIV